MFFQGCISLVDLFYFVFVFAVLSCLCHAALWSPAGKGLASKFLALLYVMFLVYFSFSHQYPGSGVVLDLSIPDLCLLPYFVCVINV